MSEVQIQILEPKLYLKETNYCFTVEQIYDVLYFFQYYGFVLTSIDIIYIYSYGTFNNSFFVRIKI